MNSNVLRAIFPILALAIQVNVSAFAVILAKMMDYKVSIQTESKQKNYCVLTIY